MKLALFLMTLSALPQTDGWSSNLQMIRSRWVLSAPQRVWAAEGSCLVIPCSYKYPRRQSTARLHLRYWKKENESVIAAVSNAPLRKVHAAFRERTSFLQKKKMDCSWMIRNVRVADAGSYFFRLHLPEYQLPKMLYSWRYQPTELRVVDPKQPVMHLKVDGACGAAVAFCSVTHTCPRHPPVLSWSYNGTALSGSSPTRDGWTWVTFSTLRFVPPQDGALKMYCTAKYDGGQRLDSNIIEV